MRISSIIFILFSVIYYPLTGLSQESEKCNLTIKIREIKNNKGTIQIALCNSQENFESRGDGFMQDSVFIRRKKAEYTFENVPYGTYAVKIYHDKNGNKILDLNSFGIPSEDYGFSNDAKGMFGPASWADAKFEVNVKQKVITINLQ